MKKFWKVHFVRGQNLITFIKQPYNFSYSTELWREVSIVSLKPWLKELTETRDSTNSKNNTIHN